MSIARSTGALLGTDESTGVTLANNATNTGAVTDMLGDNTSSGIIWLYLVFTSTVTAGDVDIRLNAARRLNSGTEEYVKVNYESKVAPINGALKIPLGPRPCPRYLSVDVLNNATGQNITNLAVLYELEKYS
jgi:hypothetical protein